MASRSENTKTPKARFAFTRDLFKPVLSETTGKKQWRVTLLFPKGADLSVLQQVAVDAAVAEWGDKAKQMIADKLIHNPFLDGDGPQGKSKKTGETHPGFAGTTFIRCISGEEFRPKLVDRNVLPITGEDGLKSGDYGFAVVNAFTWENKEKGKGISFGISMLQVTERGESLGGSGGPDPESYFEKIADEGEAPAETKSGKGAAGLFG